MAKQSKTENLRSRASKRATSPSIDVDKSVKEAPRASDATPVLGVARNSGVQKSKKKQKPMTRGQRARQEKVLARAEAVQDQMEIKVASAKSRLKKRQARKSTWDDANNSSKDETRKAIKGPGRFENLDDEEEWQDEVEPYHGDTEMKVVDGVQVPADAAAVPLVVAERITSTAGSDAEDDHDKIS